MTEFIFKINNNAKISIVVPGLQQKVNYFYEPTEKLHQFDVATLTFVQEKKKVLIYKETIRELILPFKRTLIKTIGCLLPLPNSLSVGNAGKELNYMLNDHENLRGDIISPFWFWSGTENVNALLYNIKNDIYLEIVPSYPWHFADPEPQNEKFVTFDEFMKSYTPLFVSAIPKETAQEWLAECERILKIIDYKED